MKEEHKYFGAVSLVFLSSVFVLLLLLKKYSILTLGHFIEVCRQIISTFFLSGVHFVGFILVVLTFLATTVFFAKSLFSLLKTQKSIKNMFRYKLNTIPDKLNKILVKLKLNKDNVVVINRKTKHAFVYGLKSKKIVLSTGLIEDLSQKELEAVVLHEKYHFENKHSLLLVVSEIFSSAIFFIPVIKELNKKMKTVFEKQADKFVEDIQGSNVYLNAALLKTPSSRIKFYPKLTLTIRKQYRLSKSNITVSLLAIFMFLLLLFVPVSTHAGEFDLQTKHEGCAELQCSVNCPTKNMTMSI